MVCVLFFFFFKRKTAYEMRISDGSSDVCSSDLAAVGGDKRLVEAIRAEYAQGRGTPPIRAPCKQVRLCLKRPGAQIAAREAGTRQWKVGTIPVERRCLRPRGCRANYSGLIDRKSTRLNSSH